MIIKDISIRKTLRNCLIGLIILFSVAIVLMVFLPMSLWGIRTIVSGDVSLSGNSPSMTYEDLITFAISALSLLVTIITLGAGLISIIGYIQIRNAAEKKAEEAAQKVIEEIKESVKTELEDDVALKFRDYEKEHSNKKAIDDIIVKKMNEMGLDRLIEGKTALGDVDSIKTVIGTIKAEESSEEING